jgi:hypothetical protein
MPEIRHYNISQARITGGDPIGITQAVWRSPGTGLIPRAHARLEPANWVGQLRVDGAEAAARLMAVPCTYINYVADGQRWHFDIHGRRTHTVGTTMLVEVVPDAGYVEPAAHDAPEAQAEPAPEPAPAAAPAPEPPAAAPSPPVPHQLNEGLDSLRRLAETAQSGIVELPVQVVEVANVYQAEPAPSPAGGQPAPRNVERVRPDDNPAVTPPAAPRVLTRNEVPPVRSRRYRYGAVLIGVNERIYRFASVADARRALNVNEPVIINRLNNRQRCRGFSVAWDRTGAARDEDIANNQSRNIHSARLRIDPDGNFDGEISSFASDPNNLTHRGARVSTFSTVRLASRGIFGRVAAQHTAEIRRAALTGSIFRALHWAFVDDAAARDYQALREAVIADSPAAMPVQPIQPDPPAEVPSARALGLGTSGTQVARQELNIWRDGTRLEVLWDVPEHIVPGQIVSQVSGDHRTVGVALTGVRNGNRVSLGLVQGTTLETLTRNRPVTGTQPDTRPRDPVTGVLDIPIGRYTPTVPPTPPAHFEQAEGQRAYRVENLIDVGEIRIQPALISGRDGYGVLKNGCKVGIMEKVGAGWCFHGCHGRTPVERPAVHHIGMDFSPVQEPGHCPGRTGGGTGGRRGR